MKKSAIETAINKKAVARYNKEYAELLKYLETHPIAQYLRLEEDGVRTGLVCHSIGGPTVLDIPVVNEDEVKENLIEKYEAEEVANLENKLEAIKYIFGGE